MRPEWRARNAAPAINRREGSAAMKHKGRGLIAALMALAVAFAWPGAARAVTLRLAQEYGIAYLPLIVMRSQHLLESLGKERGVPIETEWRQFTGGAAMNEALISGQLDIASGGVTPMVLLWARTRGNLDVKGIAALTSMPLYLNTIDPDVHSIGGFTDKDRIAMPAAGISIQAITLMMAAAKTFGPEQAKKLNPLMVTMSHPDGMAALLARKAGITAHFTSPPYMYLELQKPGVHRVLDSYDVLGGPATFTVAWTSSKFAQNNPKVVPIFLAALEQADAFIVKQPAEAAKIYMANTKTKLSEKELVGMIKNPEIRWTTTPERVMEYARFMAKIGMIKSPPANWKELFFSAIDNQQGS
jgi:NitT/TauT family transport system substrate-binding protein